MTKAKVKENGKAETDRPELEQVEQQLEQKTFDPFDPESLRLKGLDSLGVKQLLTTVPCTKPNKHQFVRVHPDESYRMETAIFDDKIQGESYLVSPNLWGELSLEVVAVCLFTTVTRHNDCFLWPCKLPGVDGRSNHWHESARAAAELAVDRWVRVSANMPAGRYDVFEASGNLPDPVWRAESFQELLRLCFEKRFINSVDHPILKSLRGEA